MRRIYTFYPHPLTESMVGEIITLPKEESHHLARVLRVCFGDMIQVINGEGTTWKASVYKVSGHALEARLETVVTTQKRQEVPVILVQAVPKGKTMAQIIKTSTEFGVSEIYPLLTEHTEIKLTAHAGDVRQNKLQHVAVEACKQSGNPLLPKIHPPLDWRAFQREIEQRLPSSTLKLIASLESDATLFNGQALIKPKLPKAVCWLIGPEGDFSPQEYKEARQLGFHPVNLSSNILRTESAALFSLAITMHALDFAQNEA